MGAGTAYAGARIYELSDEKKELVDIDDVTLRVIEE